MESASSVIHEWNNNVPLALNRHCESRPSQSYRDAGVWCESITNGFTASVLLIGREATKCQVTGTYVTVTYRSETPSRTLGYRLQELRVFVNNKHKYNKWTRQIPLRKIQQNLKTPLTSAFLIAMEPEITVFTKSTPGPNWAPLKV
jgi:hypothetical protein